MSCTDKLLLGTSRPSLCRRSTVALAVLVAGLGSLSNAKADVLATATRTNLTAGGGGGFVTLKLTDDGDDALAFTTAALGQKVVITFNAECQVRGGGFLIVTVNVDGVEAAPASGTNFALCSSAPGNVVNQPTGAVRQSVFVVPSAGTHSVRVDAALSVASGGWQLDDTSLVVEQ
jgi:hypothetical protein